MRAKSKAATNLAMAIVTNQTPLSLSKPQKAKGRRGRGRRYLRGEGFDYEYNGSVRV